MGTVGRHGGPSGHSEALTKQEGERWGEGKGRELFRVPRSEEVEVMGVSGTDDVGRVG